LCSDTFMQKNSLQIHSMKHTGEKPYHCDICFKKFRFAPYVKKHRMTHTGVKPHQCQLCSSSFNEKSNLTRHMLKHDLADDDLKKYCVPDNRSYKPEYPIVEELFNRMKRGEIPKQCPDCGNYFAYMQSLIEHLKNRKTCKVIVKAPKDLELQIEDPETGKMLYGCAFEGCHEVTKKLWKSVYPVHLHYTRKHKDFIELEAKCPQCDKKFLTSVILQRHIKSAHNQSNNENNMDPNIDPKLEKYCKPITRQTKNAEMLGYNPEFPLSAENYNKILDGKTPKQCPNCSRYFTTMYNLIRHWKEVFRFGCKVKYGLNRAIPEEFLRNLGEIQWQEGFPVDIDTWNKMKEGKIEKECPTCKRTFHSKKMKFIYRHFRKNDCVWQEEKPNLPPEMSIAYTEEETGTVKFVCAFVNCADYGKTFRSKVAVQAHWQMKHLDSVKSTISCSHCPEKFVINWKLQRHIKFEHPETLGLTFTCSVCGKSLKNAACLKRHEVGHQSKSFCCDYCDYKASVKATLKMHIRLKHPEKIGAEHVSFKCAFCAKSFKGKCTLKKHLKIEHTDFKPDPKFQCQICSKQLKQNNSYRKHMVNVHGMGERCNVCSKLCMDKAGLKYHKKTYHDE